jgi:hypothetical protein
MSKTYEIPPENQADYDAGYQLARSGGWLDDDPPAKTKEEVVARLVKQIGFIDGLKRVHEKNKATK